MSIPNDTPMKRRPTHPGEILREDFMPATRRAWQEAYQFMADNMS